MSRYILLIAFIVGGLGAQGQCLVNSLVVNTGYDPVTGLAIAGGANGATPVPDPHWVLSAVSPGVATAIAGTPIPGIIEVTTGSSADVITRVGAWAINPAANPGGWISCVNSNTYNDAGTGTPYNMTLGRTFRMCSDDSIKLDCYIADDNYASSTDIDGTPLSFSQPALALTSVYSTYAHFTQTVFLTAGTHVFHVVVNNFNVATPSANPTGLDLYGTVSSASGANSLVSESYASCFTYPCSSSCNIVSTPDSLHMCEGDVDTLHGTITGTDSILSILWTPATGLSGATVPDPAFTAATTSGWYVLTVQSLIPYNLVVNGDFSAGNTGFSSSYTYVSGPGSLYPESVYAIDTDPYPDHPSAVSFGDHTTGTGYMMSINGASTPINIWCETIPVLPNTVYNFSAWAANWSTASVGPAAPILQFEINGVLVGASFPITSAPGVWTQFFTTWNSGPSTVATICIHDAVTATSGNDFAIDDIVFQEVCTSKDSIYVKVNIPDTTYTIHDTTICTSIPTTNLTAPTGYSGYTWSTGSTTATVSVSTTAGPYWVYAASYCAMLIDTFRIIPQVIDTTSAHHDTTICTTVTTTNLNAPPGYTSYLWSTGSTAATVSVSTTGGPYLVYGNTGCATKVDTFHILPQIPDTTYNHVDTQICVTAGPMTLNAPPGYISYSWSTGSASPSITVTTNGAYWVYANNFCATLVDTFNASFKPSPVVNLGADASFCQGDSLVVISSQPPGVTFLWSTGSTLDSIHILTTGTYWLTASNGCLASDTIHVLVSPHPVVDLGPDTIVCRGTLNLQSSITYTAPTYLWSTGSVAPSINVTTTGTYWEQVTVAGCSGADTIHASLLYDTLHFFNHDTAICKTAFVQANVTGNPNIGYQWLPTAGIPVSNIPSPLITPDTSAMYVLTGTMAGCPDIIDSFFIDVQPNPTLFVAGDRSVCRNDTVHLQALVSPLWYTSYTYNWSPASGLDNTNTATVVYTAGDSTTIFVNVKTANGKCTATDSTHIYVHPIHFDSVKNYQVLCPGDSVQLIPGIILPGTVATYQWHPGMYLDDSLASAPWVHAITSQDYVVIATSQFGCLDTMHVNVTVNAGAVIYIGDSVTLYPGETYQISPQTNCSSFAWFPVAGLNYPFISNPIASPDFDTKYIVTGTTEWGCKAVDSISIYINPESLLAMPNAFTPGVGVNGLLKILKRGMATLNYYRIYNRWGNLVYESKDIDAGWDGTFNGKPQPYDVYVYEIEAVTSTGKVFNKHGNVTLIR